MYTSSTNPHLHIEYITEDMVDEKARQIYFDVFFLRFRWVYGLELFKKLYGF